MNDEKDFHENTFEPIEETPATDSTPVETPVVETPETAQDSTEVETPAQDNWEVRAKYWQSEAYKSGNLIKEREAELQRIQREFETQQKPAEPELKRPQKPTVSHEQDPTAWIMYGAELAEYNASMMDRDNQRRETEKQEYQRQQQALQQRNKVLGTLTQATNNPEKAQKILEHFADTRNLDNPIEYEIMFDAVMEYRRAGKKSSPRIEKAPPPPTGGGKALTEKLSPDDEFNQQLGGNSKYRL